MEQVVTICARLIGSEYCVVLENRVTEGMMTSILTPAQAESVAEGIMEAVKVVRAKNAAAKN